MILLERLAVRLSLHIKLLRRKIYLILCRAMITVIVSACSSGANQEQGDAPPESTLVPDSASSDNSNQVDPTLTADLVQVPEGGFIFSLIAKK